MRRIGILVTFLLSVNLVGIVWAANRYQIRSGIIEYQMTGDQSGTSSLYFDQFGKRESKYINFSEARGGKNNQLLVFRDNAWIYNVDVLSKTGTSINENDVSETVLNKFIASAPAAYDEQSLKSQGAVLSGKDKVLGFDCEQYQLKPAGISACLYKGIPLKVEISSAGNKSQIIATSIQEEVDLPRAKLKLPYDLVIREITDDAKKIQTATKPAIESPEKKLKAAPAEVAKEIPSKEKLKVSEKEPAQKAVSKIEIPDNNAVPELKPAADIPEKLKDNPSDEIKPSADQIGKALESVEDTLPKLEQAMKEAQPRIDAAMEEYGRQAAVLSAKDIEKKSAKADIDTETLAVDAVDSGNTSPKQSADQVDGGKASSRN